MVRIVDMERMFYVNIRIGKTFFSVLIRCTSATNSLAQCLPLADSPLVNTELPNKSNITTADAPALDNLVVKLTQGHWREVPCGGGCRLFVRGRRCCMFHSALGVYNPYFNRLNRVGQWVAWENGVSL
jgi:hypothetical protein